MKIMIVVLVVFVIAFVVLTITGGNTNKSHSNTTADNFQITDYPAVNALGSAIGAFAPKLTVAQIQPQLASFNFPPQSFPPQNSFQFHFSVLPDSSHPFRSAKFQMQAANGHPCAEVHYVATNPPEALSTSLGDQDTLKAKTPATATSVSPPVVVLSNGGAVTISRNPGYAGVGCLVTLQ
jgi:hypothetical protein